MPPPPSPPTASSLSPPLRPQQGGRARASEAPHLVLPLRQPLALPQPPSRPQTRGLAGAGFPAGGGEGGSLHPLPGVFRSSPGVRAHGLHRPATAPRAGIPSPCPRGAAGAVLSAAKRHGDGQQVLEFCFLFEKTLPFAVKQREPHPKWTPPWTGALWLCSPFHDTPGPLYGRALGGNVSHPYPATGWSGANGHQCSLIPLPSRGLSFGLGLEDVGLNSELQRDVPAAETELHQAL
ncbi:unnamed protein product [Rangifer tarandus platyrhynchus]|uniref:Uncharacterized protein n=1 Tax=Rangifer tarandus platyrhynchus TaxID=3082113 RepID=A0ABN8ZES5_RANTA|nr:unnamed protein product [Rangifer tarandus platyrhynchus]